MASQPGNYPVQPGHQLISPPNIPPPNQQPTVQKIYITDPNRSNGGSYAGTIACLLCIIAVVLVIVFWGPIKEKLCYAQHSIVSKTDEDCCKMAVDITCTGKIGDSWGDKFNLLKCAWESGGEEKYFEEHCSRVKFD